MIRGERFRKARTTHWKPDWSLHGFDLHFSVRIPKSAQNQPTKSYQNQACEARNTIVLVPCEPRVSGWATHQTWDQCFLVHHLPQPNNLTPFEWAERCWKYTIIKSWSSCHSCPKPSNVWWPMPFSSTIPATRKASTCAPGAAGFRRNDMWQTQSMVHINTQCS